MTNAFLVGIRRVVVLAGVVMAVVPAAVVAAPLLELSGFVPDPQGSHAAFDVVTSSDGKHLYTRSPIDGLGVFARDAVTGTVTRLASYQDGVGGVDGIEGSGAVGISADGANVYATSRDEAGLAIFSRNAATGLLVQTAVFRDGIGGVDGLWGANVVTVSADGANVYVGSVYDNAVAVFTRDVGTGALTFLEAERDGFGGIVGLSAPAAFVVSLDGAHLYVAGGGFTTHFSRDVGTGALTFVGSINGGGNTLAMPVSGSHLYAAIPGGVRILSRNATTGALTPSTTVSLGFSGSVAIVLSPDDAYLYATRSSSTSVADVRIFARDAVSGALTSLGTTSALPAGVVDTVGVNPRDPLVSPDGAHLYVLGDLSGGFIGFTRDPATGLLTRFEVQPGPLSTGDGLDGVQGVALDPDGSHVYAVSSRDDAIVVFDRDATTGALTWMQAIQGGPGAMPRLLGLASVVVSPDGAHVYAGAINAVIRFARDAGTGMLTYLGTDTPLGVAGAGCRTEVVMDASGTSLYSGCNDVLLRDPVDGSLTLVDENGPSGTFAVSRDGQFFYFATDAMVMYARNPIDGTIGALVDVIFEDDLPTETLANTASILVSADDRYIYTTSHYISVFEREANGGLRYRGRLSDYVFSRLSAITPDGAYLVHDRNGFELRARNPTSGTTVLAQTLPPEPSLTQSRDEMAASPDGHFMYFTITALSRIGILRLDPCGPVVLKPSLAVTKILADPTPGNDGFSLKGFFLLRGITFASLDLVASGARLQLDAADGSSRADVVLPPGGYAGGGTRGWEKKGRTWLYRDRTGALLNGIGVVKLTEGANTAAGMVAVTLKGKNGTYPLLAGDAPPAVTLTIGASGQCCRTIFDADDCGSTPTSVKCRPR
ncbi:MAG TPA: beta-propeller fold lactonase family protein [Candidatus Binatia bacterium]|jgi:6-phosphogluconolactonase (cycloisomerase 2 family)|nr:beta-propeller fold lactonase family protein [Candidatus Binatia bacterium]